jgi:hypothetical protein
MAAHAAIVAGVLAIFGGGSARRQPVPPAAVEWRFDRAQPDWKATQQWHPAVGAATLTRISDALRVTLDERTDARRISPNGTLVAGIHVDLPDWNRGDWAEIVVRARADHASSVTGMGVRFNVRDRPEAATDLQSPYQFAGENAAVVQDDTVRTYRLRADWSFDFWSPNPNTPTNSPGVARPWQGPWKQLALWFWTNGKPGSIEILSVVVVPKGAVRPPKVVEWRFDQSQPDWNPLLQPTANSAAKNVQLERRSDALRLALTEGSRQADKLLHGGIYVDLPGWRREEWARLVVRFRTTSVTTMFIGLNRQEGVLPANATPEQATFFRAGGTMPILRDGLVHTYEIGPDWGNDGRAGLWWRVGLDFTASEPGSVDILSVSVVPITVR